MIDDFKRRGYKMDILCINKAIISIDDKRRMKKLIKKLRVGKAFKTIIPPPIDCNKSWLLKNWGTELEPINLEFAASSAKSITIYFCTSATPPLGIYQKLVDKGYCVTAFYIERILGYYGWSVDGKHHICYKYLTSDNVEKYIPPEIDAKLDVINWIKMMEVMDDL